LHDHDVAAGAPCDVLADASLGQALDEARLSPTNDHVRLPLVGDLDDPLGGCSDLRHEFRIDFALRQDRPGMLEVPLGQFEFVAARCCKL
jgi:hypothetical protein